MTKNFDATKEGAFLNCFQCGKDIPDGEWFARIRMGDRRVAFCRPRCVEAFLDHPEAMTLDGRPSSGTSGGSLYAKNAKDSPRDGEQVFSPNLEWVRESQSLTGCLPEVAAQEACGGRGG